MSSVNTLIALQLHSCFVPPPLNPLSPLVGWHALRLHQFFFYYERSTGRTTWDPPHPPDQVFDSPRALQRRAGDTAVEGVVLQQTRSSGTDPLKKSGTTQHPRALVHQQAAGGGQPKRRKRVASKGNSRVYTDATLLHKDSSIENDEPRKVGDLKTTAKV